MPTIRDVAECAQVSVGTVSRVINDHPSVNPAIRRVVLSAIEELRYQPNSIARTLRTSKTRTLGLVTSDLAATTGLAGAEVAAQEHGYALLVADSRFDPQIEARNIKSLLERRVDGLLCLPVESTRVIHDLVQDSGVPTVVWGWTVANRVLPSVVLREADAVTEAIDHLVDEGHRRITVVVPDGPRGTGRIIRRQVIHETLRARGVERDGVIECVIPSPAGCARAVHDLLQGAEERPTALVIASSKLVPATLAGVSAAGLRIPRDLSLICFGDSEWARVIDPPINVIAIDLSVHLEAAARLLIGLVEKEPDLPRVIEHRYQYIRRRSVQRAPDCTRTAAVNGASARPRPTE